MVSVESTPLSERVKPSEAADRPRESTGEGVSGDREKSEYHCKAFALTDRRRDTKNVSVLNREVDGTLPACIEVSSIRA